MTNPNDAAFARPVSAIGKDETSSDQEGLTKREYFAAMAMQGLIVVGDRLDNEDSGAMQRRYVSRTAIQIADAMIAELSKEKT